MGELLLIAILFLISGLYCAALTVTTVLDKSAYSKTHRREQIVLFGLNAIVLLSAGIGLILSLFKDYT